MTVFPTVRGPAGARGGTADETGRLPIGRPGQPKGRTAVFGQDSGPYRVRHISSGQGVDGRGLSETTRNGEGRRGTAGDGTSDVL